MNQHKNDTVRPILRVEILDGNGAHVIIRGTMSVSVVPAKALAWENDSVAAVFGPANVCVFGEDGKDNCAKIITYTL